MSVTQSRHGTAFRAVGLGLAGLVVALAVVGCWHDWATTSQIAREFHTATLLADGRVLVTGGYDSSVLPHVPFASSELYDPATARFTPVDSMATARAGHTATLLQDGRVLITGGGLAGAELYAPATGQFTPTGSMTTARDGDAATLVADGRVLFVGGQEGDVAVASAEMYDPGTGQFSEIGSMSTPRRAHTATLLLDGRVLIAGGSSIGGSSVSSPPVARAELFQP